MDRQYLDVILVPLGVLLLVAYHIWFLRRLLHHPATTVMGINAANRRVWVESMMENQQKTGVLAVQTLRNNIMASTLLASMSIMLSSLIAVLMTNGWGSKASSKVETLGFVYGNTGGVMLSIKFFSILFCFLLAFLFYVQSIRYYSHGSILINVPIKNTTAPNLITTEYVAQTLNRGSYFWSLGLRAFYVSFPLFLWIFGPIPLFVCCVIMVFVLYILDISYDQWSENETGEGEQMVAQSLTSQCDQC